MTTTSRALIATALLCSAAALGGCTTGPGGGLSSRPQGVEGEWLSNDGVAVSRLNGGVFETVATDTGNKLATGSYQLIDPRNVSITGTSLIRKTPIGFNCLLASPVQLNCTITSGQQFVLNRRQATS